MDQEVELNFGRLNNEMPTSRRSSAGARGLPGVLSAPLPAGHEDTADPRLRTEDGVSPARNLVSVVDDDVSTREALPGLLWSFGFEAAPFASAEAFLASDALDRSHCLILDVVMPGMTGPELQIELLRRHQDIPIIFITAHSDDRTIPGLLSRGAVACLYKPLSETAFLEAVNAAIARGTRRGG
jgi:CheY-like chemotaxis protein